MDTVHVADPQAPRTQTFELDGRTWPIPRGMMKIGRGWRVTAPAGHPDAGRTREFKAKSLGEMGLYLSALDWFYGRPGPGRLLPIGMRLVQVGDMHLEVPKGVKRITNGWRAVCSATGVEPGRPRDFSDVDGDPNASLQRAVAWHNGIELAQRKTWRARSPSGYGETESAAFAKRVVTRLPRKATPSQRTPLNGEGGSGRGMGRPLAWSGTDNVRLLVLIAEGRSMREIGRVLGRTYRAVSQHAVRMGYPRAHDAGQVSGRAWTPEEDRFVTQWHAQVPLQVVHKVFFTAGGAERRSFRSVVERAKALGLTLDGEDAIGIERAARAVVQEAEQDSERRRQLAGVSRRMPPPRTSGIKPWTHAEDTILRDNQGTLTLRQIHTRFFVAENGTATRTYAAVVQRIGALGLSLGRAEAGNLTWTRRRAQ